MFWGRTGAGRAGCRCCQSSFHRAGARSGAEKRGQAACAPAGSACRLPLRRRCIFPLGPAQRGKGAERRAASPRLRLRPASTIPASRSRFNGEVTSTDVSSRHPVRPAAFTYFKEIRVIKKKKKKRQIPLLEEETADSRRDRPC